MTLSSGAERSNILKNLVGLKIMMATHAASMRGFIFGAGQEAPEAVPVQWVMHIQCSWRIETDRAIVVGSGDWYEPDDLKAQTSDEWDPAEGGSLQDARLRELFHDEGVSKWPITNKTSSLICTEVKLEPHEGLLVSMTGGYALRVFPAASRGEYWRVFKKGDSSTHLVSKAQGRL